jgi:hypothetical protein
MYLCSANEVVTDHTATETDRDRRLVSLTIMHIPRIIVPEPQTQTLLRLPLQRPPLPPQPPYHLRIPRNKKTHLPAPRPHALHGPNNNVLGKRVSQASERVKTRA